MSYISTLKVVVSTKIARRDRMQTFDHIQISDKAMIKLIRTNGRDYLFRASKIQNFTVVENTECTSPEHNADFGNAFLSFVINSIANSGRATKTTRRLKLVIDGDNFWIDSWTGDIEMRLKEAIDKSKQVDRRRFGEFK